MFILKSLIPNVDYKMYFLSRKIKECKFVHSECCFLTIIDGEILLEMSSEKMPMSKHDICYIPADTEYKITAEKNIILLYITFNPCFLLWNFGFEYKKIHYLPSENPLESTNEFSNLMASLAEEISTISNDNQYNVYAKALKLLDYVANSMIKEIYVEEKSKSEHKINNLKTYLSKNFSHTLSLSDAAEALNFTPQYLSNFIKKNLNITFNDLLNEYRLEAAELYLRYTLESASRISSICGFPNYKAFLKVFEKKYGLAPDEFLSQNLTAKQTDPGEAFISIRHPSSLRSYLINFLNYEGSSNPKSHVAIEKTKHINLAVKKNFSPYWKTIINLGSAEDFEKPIYRKNIKMMQSDLGFEYGRISGCLKLTKIYQLENNTHYDFSNILKIIDFLKSISLKPFLDIDNKPFRIYKEDETKVVDYKKFLETEKYDKFLYTILPHFIRTCINRYGLEEFASWKFELWRRYNPKMSSLESPEEFIKRFNQVSRIFDSLPCNYSLGGPGFNSYLETQDFEKLITKFTHSLHKPDFISACYFPYFSKDDLNSSDDYYIDPASSRMINKIADLKSTLDSKGFSDTPFYITEYTPYIVTGNYINDSTYPASFILKQTIENSGKADALGYWLASDASLDYNRPTSPLFGGNGIISRDGIKKPSYYAFEFLKKLGNKIVSKSDNFIVTTSDSGSIQVLVYLISDIVDDLERDPTNSNLIYYPYHSFANTQPVELRLIISGLVQGEYRIRKFLLNYTHGSVLNVWGDLDHSENMYPADISYLSNKSTPLINQTIKSINGDYLIHTTIAQNEINLFTFDLYQ